MIDLNPQILDILSKWKVNNRDNIYGIKSFNVCNIPHLPYERKIILRINFPISINSLGEICIEETCVFIPLLQNEDEYLEGNIRALEERCKSFDLNFKKYVIDQMNKLASCYE